MTWVEPPSTATALLLLGRGADPDTEKGVECPGDLPAPSDPDLVERAARAKAALGDRVFVLGHHYQRDEVIQFADVTGDSFKLARDAAARPDAEYIVFCGVHFMAESADILTSPTQRVVLPDLAAGCSMADMAALVQVEKAWDTLADLGITGQAVPRASAGAGSAGSAAAPTVPPGASAGAGSAGSAAAPTVPPGASAGAGSAGSAAAPTVVPVTYMNSSADIKGFVGRNGGVVCTSSNAERALRWAFERGQRVLFLPDQHLGRNTAVLKMGFSLDDCVVYDPHKPGGGLTGDELRAAKMILWRGHCSVHGRFTLDSVLDMRDRVPGVNVLVHPECRYEVVTAADYVGSTEYIIKTIEAAPAGSKWAIGTELNLVRRLARDHPDKQITFLERNVCYCSTMNRIDLPHLVWALEALVAGRVLNEIKVDEQTAHYARVGLERMLALPQ